MMALIDLGPVIEAAELTAEATDRLTAATDRLAAANDRLAAATERANEIAAYESELTKARRR